eukprot:848256-Pleurochrysis_carterae.AAC.1
MSRFPQVRTTLGGVSAAMGKLGATLGSACFKPLVGVAGHSLPLGAIAADIHACTSRPYPGD